MRSSRRSRVALLAIALAGLAGVDGAAPKPEAGGTAATRDVIALHVGVPGEAYIGQPLAEFLAHFPGARSEPFAQQKDVVRVQVAAEGISALAMGNTPASMTVESIGFNFSDAYEGVSPGKRRTVEGIGSGSSVNELLEIYGRPVQTTPEKHHGSAPAGQERVRHLYRSADGAVTSYFVVEGSRVLRLAMSRTASIDRFLLKRGPGSAPTSPETGSPAPGSGSGTR
jgi:hypothetical protein